MTPNQISAGLAQRGGTRPGANGTQERNIGGGNGIAGNRNLGTAGSRQNALNNRTAGNRPTINRGAANRSASNRPSVNNGGQRSPGAAASRPGGAFAGANSASAANRFSARGNQSLGNHASFQGRTATPAAAGGGGRSVAAVADGGRSFRMSGIKMRVLLPVTCLTAITPALWGQTPAPTVTSQASDEQQRFATPEAAMEALKAALAKGDVADFIALSARATRI